MFLLACRRPVPLGAARSRCQVLAGSRTEVMRATAPDAGKAVDTRRSRPLHAESAQPFEKLGLLSEHRQPRHLLRTAVSGYSYLDRVDHPAISDAPRRTSPGRRADGDHGGRRQAAASRSTRYPSRSVRLNDRCGSTISVCQPTPAQIRPNVPGQRAWRLADLLDMQVIVKLLVSADVRDRGVEQRPVSGRVPKRGVRRCRSAGLAAPPLDARPPRVGSDRAEACHVNPRRHPRVSASCNSIFCHLTWSGGRVTLLPERSASLPPWR